MEDDDLMNTPLFYLENDVIKNENVVLKSKLLEENVDDLKLVFKE